MLQITRFHALETKCLTRKIFIRISDIHRREIIDDTEAFKTKLKLNQT